MKCVVQDCPEKANTGWIFCTYHLSKGPDAFDIMAEEGKPPVATLKDAFCEVNSCTAKVRKDGAALCEDHDKTWWRDSSGLLIGEWIEGMNRAPAVPVTAPKQNEGKRRFSLVRREFTRAIAEVMTWGLIKYPAENYLSLDSTTIYDSMMRHLDDHLSGKKIDEESGKPHLWHFASNAMMWFMLEHRKDEGK